MFCTARKLLTASLGEEKRVLFVLLLPTARIAALLLPLDTKQPLEPIPPTVNETFPCEGGNNDAVLEAMEKWKKRAFALFLFGGLLIAGTALLLLELGVLKRVWGIELGRQ